MDRNIEKLVNFKRFANYASLLPLIIYFPFGVLVAILRFFIFLHVVLLALVLPYKFPLKHVLLRIMLCVTGMPISIQGSLHSGDKKKILISNHVSNLDPFVLSFLCPNTLTCERPGEQQKVKPLCSFGLPFDKTHNDLLAIVKTKVNESGVPLLFFPERLKTNGRSTLLKFSSLPFEVDCPIQPVTIQVKRFLFNINISTHTSSVWEDLLWCLALPMTLFQVKYLPLTERKKEETTAEFGLRVHQNMAKSLGLKASTLSYLEVTEYIKRREASLQGSQTTGYSSVSNKSSVSTKSPQTESLSVNSGSQTKSPSSSDQELDKMLMQVKDVLPDTPSHCILYDLQKTRDVDSTITNILEGRVDVSTKPPEENSAQQTEKKDTSFKASSFEKSAEARQSSFAERKQAMLETARRNYKAKHGL